MSNMDVILSEVDEVEVKGVGAVDIDFLRVDDDNISDDLDKQAAYYAFWSTVVADAHRETSEAKLNHKTVRAKRWREIKGDLKGKKGVTNPDIEAAVDEDEEVLRAKIREIDAQYRLDMAKAIMYALQQKKDMLSSKTGLRRTELDLHMKEMGAEILKGGKK